MFELKVGFSLPHSYVPAGYRITFCINIYVRLFGNRHFSVLHKCSIYIYQYHSVGWCHFILCVLLNFQYIQFKPIFTLHPTHYSKFSKPTVKCFAPKTPFLWNRAVSENSTQLLLLHLEYRQIETNCIRN